MSRQIAAVYCEFTLALNNRTGKFFFCQDMIDSSPDLVRASYFWRWRSQRVPTGIFARVLGRMARIEVKIRVENSFISRFIPYIERELPTVFTDPRECVMYRLKSSDIVLCHDMGPITHPELYADGVQATYRSAFEIIRAAKPSMMFISEASRSAFIDLYGSDFPALQIVHIPLRAGIERGEKEPVAGVPDNFFLTVGSLGTRKNQLGSIRGFGASKLSEQGYAYVICGAPEPGEDAVHRAAETTPGVILPGYVSEEQLRWLYEQARGFVLVSRLEGFGLPAAEAIAYGQVPILSPGGALQETAGDGAIYVAPDNIDGIAAAMKCVAGMCPNERRDRLGRLRENIDRFTVDAAIASWRQTIQTAMTQ